MEWQALKQPELMDEPTGPNETRSTRQMLRGASKKKICCGEMVCGRLSKHGICSCFADFCDSI